MLTLPQVVEQMHDLFVKSTENYNTFDMSDVLVSKIVYKPNGDPIQFVYVKYTNSLTNESITLNRIIDNDKLSDAFDYLWIAGGRRHIIDQLYYHAPCHSQQRISYFTGLPSTQISFDIWCIGKHNYEKSQLEKKEEA